MTKKKPKASAKKATTRKGSAVPAKKSSGKKAVAKSATPRASHAKKAPAKKSPRMPDRIIIPHDDHHGKLVGKTAKGHQFFITTPFEWMGESREFVALYLFDAAGNLVDAIIHDLGDRTGLVGKDQASVLPGNTAGANSIAEQRIAQLLEYVGPHELLNISVKPFVVERHGTQFGLVPPTPNGEEEEEPGDEVPYVLLTPGDYMAFTPPWDGSYDT